MTVKQGLGPRQRQFVAALRSEKYTYCKGLLCLHGKHCSLGVACEEFETEAGLQREVKRNGAVTWGGANPYTQIPEELIEHLGFFGNQGEPRDNKGTSLTHLNDCRNGSHETVADKIERYPHRFFKESK